MRKEESGTRRTGDGRNLGRRHWGARSTAEGVVEERGKEVLGLTQHLPLNGTQTLNLLHDGSEFFL